MVNYFATNTTIIYRDRYPDIRSHPLLGIHIINKFNYFKLSIFKSRYNGVFDIGVGDQHGNWSFFGGQALNKDPSFEIMSSEFLYK